VATKEEVLAKQTFKAEGFEVDRRVFYTLIGEQNEPQREKAQAHRNSKAIALLFKTLRENGTLTEDQLDELLFNVVM
jgi:hypothetical protein